jgi:death on curing protein
VKRPRFLLAEEVFAIHAHQLAQYGGSYGVRDANLLLSALATPEASFDGELLHPTLHEMAAAYLFHLARNHPFIDGNKRVALASALVFLQLNGLWLEAPDERVYRLVLRAATGEATKAELAEFLRAHTREAREE